MQMRFNNSSPYYLRNFVKNKINYKSIFYWLERSAEDLANINCSSLKFSVNIVNKEILKKCKVLNFQKIEGLLQNASIESYKGGYQIKFRNGLPKERFRFTIAHELGHTLFLNENKHGSKITHFDSIKNFDIEMLCDYFAAALLIPKSRITPALNHLSFAKDPKIETPLHLFWRLAEMFEVASQVVARRLLFNIWENYKIVFEIKRKYNIYSRANDWQVTWYAASMNSYGPLPCGWFVPLDRNGKKIPYEMIPDIPINKTKKIMIDERIIMAAYPQSPIDAKIPLKRFSSQIKLPAIASSHLVKTDLFSDEYQYAIIAFQ